jgi:hypothetical protein
MLVGTKIVWNKSRGENLNMHFIPNRTKKKKKVKLSLQQAVEADRVETSRPPHFLHNQLTDGGEVVSLMRRAALYP